jgi:hypothetical protein
VILTWGRVVPFRARDLHGQRAVSRVHFLGLLSLLLNFSPDVFLKQLRPSIEVSRPLLVSTCTNLHCNDGKVLLSLSLYLSLFLFLSLSFSRSRERFFLSLSRKILFQEREKERKRERERERERKNGQNGESGHLHLHLSVLIFNRTLATYK